MPSEFGFPLEAPPQMIGSVQRWSHPQGDCGLQHPPVEARQPGTAAVQRHRQMQRITGTEAQGWILQQLGRLAKAPAIERAQLNATLQQSLELFSRSRSSDLAEAMLALLDSQGAVGLGDQPVAADQGFTALRKPIEGVRAALLRGQEGHHHACV